jgi:hypothetical protein
MFPSRQIFAVEKLLPLAGVAIAGVFIGGQCQIRKSSDQKTARNKSF